MPTYEEEFETEKKYLAKVVGVAAEHFGTQQEFAVNEKKALMALSKQMYENTVHFSNDFARLVEANQALGDIETRTISFRMLTARLHLYESMMKHPYFARIDFTEDGYEREPIYIGVGSLTDDEGLDAYVYDWRAPVSGLFYSGEPGRVSYMSPSGLINGEMSLKRQYDIRNGELIYFFDCSLNVMDEVLRSALSKNTSPKMKTIVETIQREQNVIIRDVESDLLMVQGVAGSGKTSVALHRVAFLMYQGISGGLSSNNILILSPNSLFGKYISGVLPELGEENAVTKTFEDIFTDYFGDTLEIGSRNCMLEELITERREKKRELLKSTMEFALSPMFCEILDRLAVYYERRVIEVPELIYGGKNIAGRHALRSELFQARPNQPLAKRLRVLEEKLLEKVHTAKKERLDELEDFVRDHPEHQFEVKQRARLISIKETTALAHKIQAFTRVNPYEIYASLLKDKALFHTLAEGLTLPPDADEILNELCGGLTRAKVSFVNGMALLYLRIKLMGAENGGLIKQVVVDEAQDYAHMQYKILAEILPSARYTLLSDINQTIIKDIDMSFYDDIKTVLAKPKSTLVTMNKSFRCSSEISAYSTRFTDEDTRQESFDRHEKEPEIRIYDTVSDIDECLCSDVKNVVGEGFASAAVLCKSFKEAYELYERVGGAIGAKLVGNSTDEITEGVYIMPIYMAKGLEFDAVFIYGADNKNYKTDDDRKLLYIASTRPLHRLYIYCVKNKSKLLK
ncbi:MAG: 3'-5' exonuclease [Hydrogenoanaerobacterium sp.]